jgi:hypothetical protein
VAELGAEPGLVEPAGAVPAGDEVRDAELAAVDVGEHVVRRRLVDRQLELRREAALDLHAVGADEVQAARLDAPHDRDLGLLVRQRGRGGERAGQHGERGALVVAVDLGVAGGEGGEAQGEDGGRRGAGHGRLLGRFACLEREPADPRTSVSTITLRRVF